MLLVRSPIDRDRRVTSSAFRIASVLPRSLRGAMAMFVLGMYLIGGVLHGVCDLDVTNSSGKAVISLLDKSTGHPENGGTAEHHCHGCFSVSVPAPVTVSAVDVMPTVKVVPALQVARRGLPPGIDLPPPKFLI
jgi:hypothetical protein